MKEGSGPGGAQQYPQTYTHYTQHPPTRSSLSSGNLCLQETGSESQSPVCCREGEPGQGSSLLSMVHQLGNTGRHSLQGHCAVDGQGSEKTQYPEALWSQSPSLGTGTSSLWCHQDKSTNSHPIYRWLWLSLRAQRSPGLHPECPGCIGAHGGPRSGRRRKGQGRDRIRSAGQIITKSKVLGPSHSLPTLESQISTCLQHPTTAQVPIRPHPPQPLR